MAGQTETMTLLVDVQVEASKALANQQALKESLQKAKEELKSLKESEGELSQAYIAQEATVKQLNQQLAANGRVLTAMADNTDKTSGAYAHLNKEAADAARLAKDMAAAYGVNSQASREASARAKALSDNLKEIDSSVGQNQRRIGDYAGELGKLGGGFGGVVGGAQNLGASLTMLKANPFFAILSVVVTLINALSTALGSGTAAGKKLQQVMAPISDLFKGFVIIITEVVGAFADGIAAITSYVAGLLDFIPAVKSANEASRESVRIEREKQKLIREGILDKAQDAKEELRISELKKKLNEKDKYSKAERLAFAREIDRTEKALALDDANRANNNLKNFLERMKQQGKAQKDFTDDELKELSELQANKYKEQQKYFDNTRKTASREAELLGQIRAEDEASHAASLERKKKREEENSAWRKAQTEADIKAQDEANARMIKSREDALKAVENLKYEIESEPEIDTGNATKYLEDLENAKQLIRESSDLAYLDYQQTQLDKEYQAAIANAQKIGADTTAIDAAYAQSKKEIAQAEMSAKMDLASGFAGNIAEIFGKNTKVGKAAASAQIAIDTAKGAMSAFASFQALPPPFGTILGGVAAGAVITKGIRSIKDVWAVKSGLPGDSGGGGASVPTSAANVSAVTGSVVARQSGSAQQAATTTAVDSALKSNPTQAVLVTNDLTTALENKVQLKTDNSL